MSQFHFLSNEIYFSIEFTYLIFIFKPAQNISFLTWFAGDLAVYKLYAFRLETHKPNCKLTTLLWTFLPFFAQFDKTTFINHFDSKYSFCLFCQVWQTSITKQFHKPVPHWSLLTAKHYIDRQSEFESQHVLIILKYNGILLFYKTMFTIIYWPKTQCV